MSEHDEPSYYEVALTSRQVMVAFLLLLGCLLAAFFAGLWVGRDSVSPPPPQTAEIEATQASTDPLEQFSFFEDEDADEEAAPATTQPTETASRDTSPAPPPIREDPPPRRQPERTETERPPPVEPPAEPRTRPEPAPTSTPPATEEPAQTATETASSEAPAETLPRTNARRPEPPPSGNELFVQVFSSPDQEQAQRVRRRLNDNGYSAFLSPVEVDDRTMYRVRIGPFIDRADAERVADRVKVAFRLDTWITSAS